MRRSRKALIARRPCAAWRQASNDHWHDAKFFVQIGGKHKTGFFCDQRDNRKRWGGLIAATKSHRCSISLQFRRFCCPFGHQRRD